MQKMPYALTSPDGNNRMELPREITAHLSSASESDIKVILYLYSEFPLGFEKSDEAKIAYELSLSGEEVASSIAFWRGAGILKNAKSVKKSKEEKPAQTTVPHTKLSRPLYPAEQVAKAIEDMPNMKELVDFCQRRFGKIFNPSQLSALYSFYDNLGFGVDIIMLVAEHCAITDRKSLGYVEKMLITMSDGGITSYSDAEEFLQNKLRYTEQEKKLRKLCGFTSRELTPSEKKIIGTWFNEWHIDFPLIEKAYELTVDRISKPNLKYMNTILSDWHSRGIEDITQFEDTGSLIEKSHDADEFFKAALAKSMGDSIIQPKG